MTPTDSAGAGPDERAGRRERLLDLAARIEAGDPATLAQLRAMHGPRGPWPCEAYGLDGLAHGARCFVAGAEGGRECASPAVCHAVLSVERRRIFDRIRELAASDDPAERVIGDELGRGLTSPEQLLGGAADLQV